MKRIIVVLVLSFFVGLFSGPSYRITTYYLKDNKVYTIIGSTHTKEAFDKHEDEYNRMINSFTILKGG